MDLEERVARLELAMKRLYEPEAQVHVLPGGMMPKRMSQGAVGYDVFIRAIVDSDQMDPANPVLRKTVFDFKNDSDPRVAGNVVWKPSGPERVMAAYYRIDPGSHVLVGIGAVIVVPPLNYYRVTPRSGLASRYGVTLGNAPGTVDSDYRGEAGVIVVNNGKSPFLIYQGMRIAQVVFGSAVFPRLTEVDQYDRLDSTARGSGGFGSTGL